MKIFVYGLYLDPTETDVTVIRIYGICGSDIEGYTNCCLRIDNFTPFVYLELPDNIRWNESKAQMLGNKIDDMMGKQKPINKSLMMKFKLYYAHLNKKGKRKMFPYLFCSFSNKSDIIKLSYKLRKNIYVSGLGNMTIHMHEQDASPILQLCACRGISTAGWIKFKGKEVSNNDKITICDYEYKVRWKNIGHVNDDKVALPKIMGFDIEVNSTNPSAMPKATKPGDKIFQISCVMAREGCRQDEYVKYLLTLGNPDQMTLGKDIIIRTFYTESELLVGFTNLIREENPNIIAGYNILGFDIPYMIERAKTYALCISGFDKLGFLKFGHAQEKTIKWSSQAYGTQEFQFLDGEGRLFVDLLPLVKRDYKMDNYKLKTVSTFFIGDTKDDLSPKGIFKCYREGIKKNKDGVYLLKARKAMGKVGKYCIQDSVLVIKLMDKLQTWVGLCEMAKTCSVPIFSLYTQGQQIKVYSQIYKYCMYNNIVVEKDGYTTASDERFVGAHVFEPKPGVYDRVVSVDFASLYPSTIIAYNIDYSTLVTDEDIPDEKCNVMEWSDHIGCKDDPKVIRKQKLTRIIDFQKGEIKKVRDKKNMTKDKIRKAELLLKIEKMTKEVKPYQEQRAKITKPKFPMCCERKYRFLKEPKGVMPTVLENLLNARKNTRLEIKIHKKEIEELKKTDGNEEKIKELTFLNIVLDKRQLSYKISCNSMYGAMGVRRGYLPFMPGAMCISKDSKISFSHGFTRRIEDIVDTTSLWSYNDGQIVSYGNGLKYNGKREVIKITLIDGRTLRCTPDHKIMTVDGWIEAEKLVTKYDWDGDNFTTNSMCSKVVVGLELPEDIIGDYEKDWKLLDYTMDSPDNREKTLAFCRILGFILADGYIGMYLKGDKKIYNSKVDLGTLFDSNMFINDIKILTGKEPKINNNKRDEIKGSTFSMHIPKILVDKIILLEGIPIGKRTHQPYTLPSFLLETNCPLSVIREFLGGLFGGDGTSPSLSISHPSFSPIQLGLSTIEKYKDDMDMTMNNLVNLIDKFGITFWCNKPKISRIREHLKPKDIKENPRWEYIITTNGYSSLLFAEKIGFRYCSDKNNKLTIAASYQRYSDNARKQHINLVLSASKMFDLNKGKFSMKYILEKTRKEVYKNNIPIDKYASLSKCTDIYNHRSRPRSLKNYKLLKKYFPTAREYTKMTDCEHWFSKTKSSPKIYSQDRLDTVSPCIHLDVIDVRYDGIDDVYDIIDVPNKSFIANGMVVHNCTTYMGRKNIELVAKTITEKYKGELIYGDSVTGDTPILCKINDKICYRTIDDLPQSKWDKYHDIKEEAIPFDVEVWTEKGFTKIKRVIRHKTDKEIFRVLTHTGVVDVTEDHGLLDRECKKISPKELNIGDGLLTVDLPKVEIYECDIDEDEAFVLGLMYADGSCGSYACPSGDKSSWAINNQNRELLEKCRDIMNTKLETIQFKILETMKSSRVLKLVPCGKGIVGLVKKWRKLLYDKRRYKKVPDKILYAPKEIRQSFLDGYYSGDDGDKDKNGYYRFDNKGKIGASGLYYLAQSLGCKVSINTRTDKPDIYRLTFTKKSQRKKEYKIKKLYSMGKTEQYVYDLETENHHFSAGIGKLIVHNTDSNYITFPHLETSEELWDYSIYVAKQVSKLFPPAIVLEFEDNIYWRYLILTKKRYMYTSCKRDGVISDKMGKKGVLLARRDNSPFVRNIYQAVIMKVFNRAPMKEVLYFILQEINKLCSGTFCSRDFVVTKAVGDSGGMKVIPFYNDKGIEKGKVGDYTVPLLHSDPEIRENQLMKKDARNDEEYYMKCLPAQVQLAAKMIRRGQRVDPGTRLEYVITESGGHTAKQYKKLESIDYYDIHNDILRMDYMYYLKLLTNSMDQVLNTVYKNEPNFEYNFTLNQYKFRLKIRRKVLNDIENLFKPKIMFT
jgi:DNA polymerase elongation subunit (family B)